MTEPDARSTMKRRTCAAAALLVGLALGVSACSSGSAPSGVASLNGQGATTQPTGPITVSQGDQAFVNFTRCMRAHGVQMSDPFHRPGHQGLSISLPIQDAATSGAFSACQHFLARVEAAKAAAGAARAALNLPALSMYSQCMRGHDIAMLDPDAQGKVDLGTVSGNVSDFGRTSPQFHAADSACRHFLPAGVQDDGTGP